MSWDTPVPIFEDEDEDELVARFVELSAAHSNEPPIAITNYIFEKLRDPIARANQAALRWSTNLSIRERIRQAKNNGGKELKKITKDELQAKILATTEDETLHHLEKRVRLQGYMNYAQTEGWVMKENDGEDNEGKKQHFPQIVFAVAEQRAA